MEQPPAAIATDRLDLVPLTPPILRAILSGDAELIGLLLNADGPTPWPSDTTVIELRLNQLSREPSEQPFLLRALRVRESRTIIGHAGFHTPPDPLYLRELGLSGLECGYTVFAPHRGRGYATEAVRALIAWAHREHGVADFVLSIAPDNEPSLRIARKLGFSYHSVYNDPADGTEHVYTLQLPST